MAHKIFEFYDSILNTLTLLLFSRSLSLPLAMPANDKINSDFLFICFSLFVTIYKNVDKFVMCAVSIFQCTIETENARA